MFMKRKLTIFTLLLATLAPAVGQTTMRDVFKQMPDSLMPYLSQGNRLDFIDFMDSNMKAEVTNQLDGKSQMTALTDDSLSVRMNDMTRIDLFLVPAVTTDNDTLRQVVCMVTTLTLANHDTEISVAFYETSWTAIPDHQLVIRDERRKQAVEALKQQKSLKFYDRVHNEC